MENDKITPGIIGIFHTVDDSIEEPDSGAIQALGSRLLVQYEYPMPKIHKGPSLWNCLFDTGEEFTLASTEILPIAKIKVKSWKEVQ